MEVIKGGKAERLYHARELMMLAIMTGDDSYFEQVEKMARQDSRRANLYSIGSSTSDRGSP